MTIQLETIIILNLSNNHIYIDNVHALMCAKFCPLSRYIRYINRPTNALGSMDVVLLHNGHQHVLATHVAICRVVRERIQIKLMLVSIIPQLKKKMQFLVKIHG